MNSFLHETARDLYERYGSGISSLHLLFPSQRARLFFTDALAQIARRPLWQPHWITVDELMAEVSGLHTADRLRLIAELYKTYSEFHDEPFDKFYFWGDMLLNDFDTVDKYMVDARMLFRNIADIKEIESDLSYLTPQQLQTVAAFWGCFGGGEEELSKEKRRFLETWRTLADIYERFRSRLAADGIAYGGMMHRAAAEMLRDGRGGFASERRYAVIGFNALSECEKQLFRSLEATGRADFYWDYDSYYCDRSEQEAGMFLRDNIRMFPPRAAITHDSMTSVPKRLTSVAAPSNAVQCKYLPTILAQLQERNGGTPLDKETAIVLTDENLLMTVLHSLPESTTRANVTMGYPLRRTLAYSFVERLIELQIHRRTRNGEPTFWHADVSGLLAHPYIAEYEPDTTRTIVDDMMKNRRIHIAASALGRNPLLATIFRAAERRAELEQWLAESVAAVARLPYSGDDARQRTEFLAVIAEEISKTRNSLEKCGINDIGTQVYTSLLRKHLQTLRIPFDGEPLEGIQIMGILETRNIDFKNVIILSMTDDNFPGALSSQSSFVPYNLRAAYSLPTPEHHEGVYAYYFYRLIQRAENVFMCYCSHADDKTTGEPSRYIRQLEFESGFAIERTEVGLDVTLAAEQIIEIAKDKEVEARMMRFVDTQSPARLSPTAFYRYVACPLRFYFATVAQLSAEEEISDEVDARTFGNILHGAMQILYERIRGQHAPAATLRAMASAGEVESAVEQAIREKWLNDPDATRDDYSGNLTLVGEIVARYIRDGIMRYDAANDDFTVTGLEEKVESELDFESGGRRLTMHFFGYSDRIDRLGDGSLRVVDYKTGTPHLEFASVGSLFGGSAKERMPNIIQTLLYSMMLRRKHCCEVVPALYYVQKMASDDYSPRIIGTQPERREVKYSECAGEFEEQVRAVLAEMYDMSVPFRQCDDRDTCTFCDYKQICNR